MTTSILESAPHSTTTAHCGRVLVVDDHAQARESIADVLRHAGHTVHCLASAIEALQYVEHENVDAIITDLQMPGMDGLDFIRHLERRRHGAQIVMVTAHASVSTAVDAMRHGAFDYIEKPFDADQLEQLVARAMRQGRMLDRGGLPTKAGVSGPVMLGESRAMRALRARIAQVGPTSETVLIVGESGTGKELVAQAVHAASLRKQQPLVSLNCPVLSAQLMESELFGHERGAFTGAESRRTGRFELAHGGTILLDEITEIELGLQAKLLRVLQERRFERVGSSQTMDVDVRVLATTNRDLRAEIAAGRFREDLYFRLNVVPLTVPPLRERREDVPELAAHFLGQAAERLNKEPCELEPEAAALLVDYHWPGNVRELENLMTRATVLNLGLPIAAEELRPWLIGEPQTHSLLSSTISMTSTTSASTSVIGIGSENNAASVNLREMERQLIESTLERFNGHRAQTAQALGIGIRTLSGKLKEYGYAPRTKNFGKKNVA